MKASFYKIESNHTNVPYNELNGEVRSEDDIPKIGQNYYFEDFLGRWVMTTPVLEVNILDEGDFIFKTKNSTYRLVIEGMRGGEDA